MKTTWKGELFQGLEELPVNEEMNIVGGETMWYWLGYGISLAGYMLTHPSPRQSSGQQLMNAALG